MLPLAEAGRYQWSGANAKKSEFSAGPAHERKRWAGIKGKRQSWRLGSPGRGAGGPSLVTGHKWPDPAPPSAARTSLSCDCLGCFPFLDCGAFIPTMRFLTATILLLALVAATQAEPLHFKDCGEP